MEGANGLWWKEPGGCLRIWQISAQQGSAVSTSLKIKRDHEATFQGMEKGMSMLIESWIDKHGSHCSCQPAETETALDSFLGVCYPTLGCTATYLGFSFCSTWTI